MQIERSLDWVIGFTRAGRARDELIAESIYSSAALDVLRGQLTKHRHKGMFFAADLCNGDIQLIHRDFQFNNRDFRMWQLKHQRGGDYIIYTNKQSLYLEKPIRVMLP